MKLFVKVLLVAFFSLFILSGIFGLLGALLGMTFGILGSVIGLIAKIVFNPVVLVLIIILLAYQLNKKTKI